MKYFKNLLKNKNYKAIIFSIVFFLVGCVCLYINFNSIIKNDIQYNGLNDSVLTGNFIIDIISRSNWGMVIVGIINIYTGLIFAPRNYKGSQDDEDYVIKTSGDYIEIKYKAREFAVKKETFNPCDLFFKDKNGKFVSMTTGYQIYNYVMNEYKEKTEKEIKECNTIGMNDVITKFSNLRLMSNEEKKWYIEHKKLKYRRRRISFSFSIIFYILGFFRCLGNFNLFDWFVGIIFIAIGILCNKISKRQINLIDKINQGNVYIADCWSYDKKIFEYSEGTDYLIKVKDNNGYCLDKWFKIPADIYKRSEVITAKLVVIEKDAQQIDIVIT